VANSANRKMSEINADEDNKAEKTTTPASKSETTEAVIIDDGPETASATENGQLESNAEERRQVAEILSASVRVWGAREALESMQSMLLLMLVCLLLLMGILTLH